jgi:hypothetical protein
MANPDRKGGGGLSLQTLVIASAGSVTAAMVSSRLFPPGTVYASALTPVIVAAVSEALNRPASKASELARQRRALMASARSRQAERVLGGEPHPLRGAPEFAQGAAADEELGANGDGAHARQSLPPEVRIHRTRRWGRIHPKMIVATGLVAFAIAVAVVTLPELVFGGAVATTQRTTFFGGGHASTPKQSPTKTQTQTTTQAKTVTQTVPAQTTTGTTTTGTTTTTSTDTATQTTPAQTQTQTTPTDTGTSTAPAPGAPPTP